MQSRGLKALALVLPAVFSACGKDAPSEPLSPQSDRQASINAQPVRPVRPHDDAFARVGEGIPEFAGAYFDQGNMVIVLTDTRRAASAHAAMQDLLRTSGRGDVPYRVAQAKYPFVELARWRDLVHQSLGGQGINSIAVDIPRNRPRITVKDETVVGSVESALERLGIPAEARDVSVRAPIVQLAYLGSRVRPLRGGLAIFRYAYPNVYRCTYGYGGRLNNAYGFVINSHCTPTDAALDLNSPRYQPWSLSDQIGVEKVDPAPFSCTIQGGPALCRYADAAFYQFTVGASNYDINMIAKTSSDNTIASGPQWNIYADDWNHWGRWIGDTVSKVGSRTGTTSGVVSAGCVDEDSNTTIGGVPFWYVCQFEVTMISSSGDSGSPVFYRVSGSGANQVILAGLVWSGYGCQPQGVQCTTTIYSPVNGINMDLGVILRY